MSIATLTATGGTGSYTWTKIGGDDAAKFTLTTGGVLGFVSPLDFEHPTDADGDNIYLVQVQCSDGVNTPATQIIAVQITDVVEPIVITSPATFNAAENQTAVATLTASGGNSGPYTWTKTGGADAAKFTLTTGGVLTFTTAPDFEAPTDADANNIYVLQVQVADGVNTPVAQTISVTVTNVVETAAAQQQALSSSRAGVGSRIITEDHTGKTRII